VLGGADLREDDAQRLPELRACDKPDVVAELRDRLGHRLAVEVLERRLEEDPPLAATPMGWRYM
jgi:hypothetical protein